MWPYLEKKKATHCAAFSDFGSGGRIILAYGPHSFGAAASGVLRTSGLCYSLRSCYAPLALVNLLI